MHAYSSKQSPVENKVFFFILKTYLMYLGQMLKVGLPHPIEGCVFLSTLHCVFLVIMLVGSIEVGTWEIQRIRKRDEANSLNGLCQKYCYLCRPLLKITSGSHLTFSNITNNIFLHFDHSFYNGEPILVVHCLYQMSPLNHKNDHKLFYEAINSSNKR